MIIGIKRKYSFDSVLNILNVHCVNYYFLVIVSIIIWPTFKPITY